MVKTQDRYGPGIWFVLHLQAAYAETDELKRAFIQNVKTLGQHFPCEQCRPHFAAYIQTHPIETYVNKPRGLFQWTWEFHDSVNKRLGKPTMEFEEAWSQFRSKTAVCTDDCGETSEKPATTSKAEVKYYTIASYQSYLDRLKK
jgi:hypothetical protein